MAELLHRAQVFRLYPTPAQEERLRQWIGAVRFTYNLALEQRRDWWRPGRSLNMVTQSREITQLRADLAWLADVPRDCLTQALRDLEGAYKSWWSDQARAPGFRERGANDSISFPQPRHLGVRATGRRMGCLRLPKLGDIPLRHDRTLSGDLRSVTVSLRGGRWWAACATRVVNTATPGPQVPVGIDRGIRVFAALSTGELIAGPNVGRKAAKALARAQRNLARKKPGSRNRDKQRRRVSMLHIRLADARKDFLHRTSTKIAQNHSVVVLENLQVGKMTRRACGHGRSAKAGLNRAILDQGWGMFHRFLAYKLAERGGELVLVPANDTSRTCAACGVVDKESRAGPRFKCTACGHEDDADLNAAINILRRGRTPVLPVEASPSRAADEAGTSGRAA